MDFSWYHKREFSGERLKACLLQVVLLPILKYMEVYKSATNQTQAAMAQCYQASMSVNVDMRANLNCTKYGYSVMTQLYNGAIGQTLSLCAKCGIVIVAIEFVYKMLPCLSISYP